MSWAAKKEKSWTAYCEDCGVYQNQVYRTGKNVKRPCKHNPKCTTKIVTIKRKN